MIIIQTNKSNIKTFLEIAQQKLNQKKGFNQKNYKYIGTINFITKSGTNTNDDINSSISINIIQKIKNLIFYFLLKQVNLMEI